MNISTAVTSELMPLNRLAAAYLTETRYEFMRMLRNPGFVLPFLGIPVAAYLLFGVAIAGDAVEKDPSVAIYLFSGFSVLAVIGPALFGIGCTLASEREVGLMQFKRALPAPLASWLVAKMLVAVAFGALAYAPVLVAAVSVGQVGRSASELVAMSAVLIVGVVPFCAIGLLLGVMVSASAAPAYTNLIYLPMLWLSGLFIPLPAFLHTQTLIWPAFHLNQIALRAGGVEQFKYIPTPIAIGVLAGVTVLCGALAVWRLARKG